MTYVYDLILNFNDELYDFYEWQKLDTMYHIKRINLIKISSSDYNNILDYHVIFDDEFLLNIFNRCEYYDGRNINKIPYAVLISDTTRVMAIILNMQGEIVKYSSLLLDEEEDILDLVSKNPIIKLHYQKKDIKHIISMKTRNENKIIKLIKKDLNNTYQDKDLGKLKYLYYEYFNKTSDDIDLIYQSLMKELNGEISNKHYNLYNLIKLSYSHKIV